ncbi:hypothetical protein DPMN_062571 [Dreissena polymorpha]|uniref:Uncharacterized protein n=1 Tax=Dreissena polymorpha TaxID=45954 RepID=A0A9D4HJE2_DREPO|nr:hypothetical protein DPMN_062571 [Dreissena polymorpha]
MTSKNDAYQVGLQRAPEISDDIGSNFRFADMDPPLEISCPVRESSPQQETSSVLIELAWTQTMLIC